MLNDTIKLQPGALDDMPIREMAIFLAQYGLALIHRPDGLYIEREPRHE